MFYNNTTTGQKTVQSIDEVMTRAFGQVVIAYMQAMNDVWRNPQLSPQQVMDAFGVNAGDLVTKAYLTKAFLLAIQPDLNIDNAPANITINDDGTVTLSPLTE